LAIFTLLYFVDTRATRREPRGDTRALRAPYALAAQMSRDHHARSAMRASAMRAIAGAAARARR
jgi:hypothetical protein